MEEKHIFISGNFNVSERISSDKRRKTKRRKRNNSLFVAALAFFSLSFAALCAAIFYLDSNGIVPDKLFGKITIGIIIFAVLRCYFLFLSQKSNIVAFLSTLFSFAVFILSVYCTYALHNVYKSVDAVETPKVFYAQIGVYVKKESIYAPYEIVTDDGKEIQQVNGEKLEGCSIGTIITNLDKGYTSQGIRILRKEINVDIVVFEDFNELIDAFRNDTISAIIYNEAFLESYVSEDNDFYEWAIKVKSIGIENEHIIDMKKADVVSEPFIVYISGLDTSKIDYFPDAARCDGNIIAAVDPVNKKILLVNTPRDYYVPLWGDDYYMDKLTHAGIFGVECSMETLESLYDIKFNYYVRFNVYSVVNIVDALGGITVHSDFNFTAKDISGNSHYFYVGENEIDGADAIAFVRERYSFANGDRQRGIHQQECIRAIIEKACSPAIIAHFSEVLDVVEKCIRTNIGQDEINSLIRMQISDMASWSIESISVDGYGSYSSCYAMGGESLYTMIPYYDTVNTAKDALLELIGS